MQIPNYNRLKKNSLRKTLDSLADKRRRSALELGLTTFTILLFGIFAIKPTFVTIADLNRDIETQEEILGELSEKAVKLEAAQRELERNANKLILIEQAIPNEGELAQLFKQIKAMAKENNLNIVNMQFNNYNPQELAKGTSSEGEKASSSMWGEVELTMQLEGEYANLKKFWEGFESMRRIIITSSVTFRTDEEVKNKLTMNAKSKVLFNPIKSNEK